MDKNTLDMLEHPGEYSLFTYLSHPIKAVPLRI